ncbi:carbon monoxide dehydrogenase subunit G [Streptomyces dangxiongensis]|uniref:Carbon monoxide dehydrogenase subunit G n=1 Tax=Streptomyces dangxiongensis TaxID=1442032 RepID=A0A3G2JFW3_9ACTN|nr:SRPBCC family protein [Streptomyces dangxiongensis]AYN40265.1 carbon monoxide dehydrogenase subunit G [Streptomyces dangxiongensis]
MEHQVFVPVSAERLRAALADPARVARAVPGLQQDAGAAPIAGRLKLRVGGHSVTYRGALRVTARADGTYAVDAEAGEARGDGSVRLALTLRLADGDGGCTVTVRGTADADGRITELPSEAVTSAATRLLNRFVAALATDGAQEPEPGAGVRGSRYEAEVPASSPVPGADDEPGGDDACPDRLTDDFTDTGDPPAEAAHARRTMIGRSAEEVDHAPPRGRYAPVPAPQTIAGNPALRWAAPAAALALASAVVLTRALRKRR